MREIVHVQIGNCGNNVGSRFFHVIADEHGLNEAGKFEGDSDLQLQRINVYFAPAPDCKYVPRAILVDLDDGALASIKCGPRGCFYNPENYVAGTNGAANNWAKGFYTEGAELAPLALDVIRKEAEACDLMQGIQIVHSLGGGTGAGMGALLMVYLKEEYPERIVKSYSVIPAPEMSTAVVEPYNAVLTLARIIDATDQTFCLDNRALYRACTRVLKLSPPSLADSNHLIASCMSGITSCLRFPGQLNTDLRKLHVNLVPFPRLHFFAVAYAPLQSRSSARYQAITAPWLSQELFHKHSMLTDCDPKDGKCLALAAIFRGRMSAKLVDEQIAAIRAKNSNDFVDWIPKNVQTAMCDVAPRGISMCGSLVSNTAAIRQPFKRIGAAFDEMLNRKAYVHWYTGEGMEEEEFRESRETIHGLLIEYQQREATTARTSFQELPVEHVG